MTAVVSGRIWQSLPAADRELIAKTVKTTLDAPIDELVGNGPKLIESFKNAPIPIRQVLGRRLPGRHHAIPRRPVAQHRCHRQGMDGLIRDGAAAPTHVRTSSSASSFASTSWAAAPR